MRWKDAMKNDVEELRGQTDWKARVTEREGRKGGIISVLFFALFNNYIIS